MNYLGSKEDMNPYYFNIGSTKTSRLVHTQGWLLGGNVITHDKMVHKLLTLFVVFRLYFTYENRFAVGN